MEQINTIRINFNPDQLFLLNICLAFLMFGVALDLRVSNFRQLIQQPKAPLIGLCSQLVMLPLLTLLLIFFLQPPTSIGLGMLLVAACPGGNVSNFAVHLAGANSALSVLMTSLSTLCAIVITPLYFTFLSPFIPGVEQLQTDIFVDPGNMIITIIQLILLPLAFGMFLHHRFPRLTDRLRQPVKFLSILIFLGFVLVAIYANYQNIANYLHIVFLIVLSHNALALSTGYLMGSAGRLPRADVRAIALETGIQNSGLGLILIFNFFNGLGGMALIAAWWGIWHLISAFSLAMFWGQGYSFRSAFSRMTSNP